MKTIFSIDKEKLESSMTRVFNASRELVWKAHATQDLIEKWWGPRKYTTKIKIFEPKIGGKWKFINTSNGQDHIFYGDFLEVKEPEIITWTFTYAPYPGIAIVETVTFEDLPEGKTKLHMLSKYPSILALEGMMQGGMQEAANETWDRLEEILIK